MQITLITTKNGEQLLSQKGHDQLGLESEHLFVYDRGASAQKEILELLDECEVFRQRLGQASRYNNPYGFYRQLEWYENRQEDQPCAFVFKDENNIIAILFMRIGDKRLTSMLGSWAIPSLKLITLEISYQALVYEENQKAYEAVVKYLNTLVKNGIASHIHWSEVYIDSNLYQIQKIRHFSGWLIVETPKVRWQTKLIDPSTGDRIQHNSAKTRSTQRRKDRQLVNHFDGDVHVAVIKDTVQVDEFIEKAANIVNQTYQAALNIGVREGDKQYREYLHELAKEGVLRGYLLMAKGNAIAYVLGDMQSQTFNLWATSFLPEYRNYSPGTVLIRRVFEELASEEVVIFDFGWGDSQYKRVFGSQKIDEADMQFYAKRGVSLLAYLNAALSSRFNRTLWRLRSSGKLDKPRRVWRYILHYGKRSTF